MLSTKFKISHRESINEGTSGNLIIQGDNQVVLSDLASQYSQKIRCIYIDPPYNNGEVYHYYSDNDKYEKWLENIKKTLTLLHPLLSIDGSIWISIDDREMHYLKVVADKIFGRENFVSTIVWQHRNSRENRTIFSNNHEYILLYAKDIKHFKKSRNTIPMDKSLIESKYKNLDNDFRGVWQSVTANVQDGHAVPSQYYYITSQTGKKHYPPKGRCWIYNEDRMNKEIAANNIWFGLDGNGVPRVKKFLKDVNKGLTPETLWLGKDVGTTKSAKKHILNLFPDNKAFETPKPEELISRILEIATNEGDLVLDCYLGSGSTISTAHKMSRKYIGVEIGDHILDLVVKRMKMVIGGEQGGISKAIKWKGGGGFDFYTYNKKEK